MFQACQAENCHLLPHQSGNISRSSVQTLNPTCNLHLFGRNQTSQFNHTITQRCTLWHIRLCLCHPPTFLFAIYRPGSCSYVQVFMHDKSTYRGRQRSCQCTAHSMLKSHNLWLYPRVTSKFRNLKHTQHMLSLHWPFILPLPTLLVLCPTRKPSLASQSFQKLAQESGHCSEALLSCNLGASHNDCCFR